MNRFPTLLVVAVAWLACSAAQAQWQWTDKDGRKVFSDRAPPSDVPAKNILRQPGMSTRASEVPANAAPTRAASAPELLAGQSASGVDTPKLSGVDKELADKKKLAEAAMAAKTKAEEERVAKARVENCDRAKSNKAVMDSGVRVSQTDAKGERIVMDDAARTAELKRIQTAVATNCR